MSQANISEFPTPQCNTCVERSTWSFIGDFYKRVELAHQYARQVEEDLLRTAAQAQQSIATITRYEQSFSIVNSRLEDALKLLESERKNHTETSRLFDMAYNACTENATLINNLQTQIADLQRELALLTPAPDHQSQERGSSVPTIPCQCDDCKASQAPCQIDDI